jgi:predicted patatin/cPLA2 family phospholipase
MAIILRNNESNCQKTPIRNGRLRLRLDYYPALIDPLKGKETRYENLKLYLYAKPQTGLEKNHNKETEQLAENIRARRQLDLQSQLHGFKPDYKRVQSFTAYFRKLANRQRA